MQTFVTLKVKKINKIEIVYRNIAIDKNLSWQCLSSHTQRFRKSSVKIKSRANSSKVNTWSIPMVKPFLILIELVKPASNARNKIFRYTLGY